MNLLLDTHVWIWSQEQPRKLGRRTKGLLLSPRNRTSVCTISTLEIARLIHVGGLRFSMPFGDWIQESLKALAAETIPVSHVIAAEAYSLPGAFHQDPADRVLIAAARYHGLTLVTADDRILEYREVRSQNARR